MPPTRTISAMLAAGALGVGLGACADRENVERSNNQERGIPSEGPTTVQDPKPTLTPTSTQQPTITQPAPSQTP